MITHEDLIALAGADDLATVLEISARLGQDLGFPLFSGTLIRGRLRSGFGEVYSFGNPPAGFSDAFRSPGESLIDPVFSSILRHDGHLSYDQGLYVRAGVPDLFDAQSPFGYRAGLCFSMHSQGGDVFQFGFDGPDPLPVRDLDLMWLRSRVKSLAVAAQEAALNLFTTRPRASEVELEEAEREALCWAANATVHWQRGTLVQVSQPYAAKVASAAHKLGTRTRTGTVLRAIKGGLIKP